MADAADNPGLVADCDTLLAGRDTLAGSASLNWSASTPIDQWEGIAVGGTPLRVTRLKLQRRGLTGEIPAGLGGLSSLVELDFWFNQLSGTIPSEIGDLANLELLHLSRNRLNGSIPAWLPNLSNLVELKLGGNQFTGTIPPELGSLSNLEHLALWGNQLTSPIPPELGNLSQTWNG